MKKIAIAVTVLLATFSIMFYIFWSHPAPSKLILKNTSFEKLPGWHTTSMKTSLDAFRMSCKTFLKQDPEKSLGSEYIKLYAKDWQPACRVAMSMDSISDKTAKDFFQNWFMPVEFYKGKPIKGLFTGYFMPSLSGSLNKTIKYNVPLYGIPSNLITANLGEFNPTLKNKRIVGRIKGSKLVPFYTRDEINHGAIHKKAAILAWLSDPMERVFLEIEGSGVVELNDGKHLYIGYAGQNGAAYTSIASILIKQGVMSADEASSEHIKNYLNANPNKIDSVLNQNKSFVFFQKLKNNAAVGAQGVALTPGYSLAVDPKWVPYGTPTWLSTKIPSDNKTSKKFNRLMIAQDTGGAIRGIVRGDVFWGAGAKETFIASHMRDEGRYWLLLPRHTIASLN